MAQMTGVYAQSYGDAKQSGFGIASFAIAMLTGVGEFFLVIAAGVLETVTPGGINEESLVAIVLGLFLLGGMMMSLLGMGLGVAGLVQADRKKVFSTLGLLFNGMIIFGVISLMIIGSLAPA